MLLSSPGFLSTGVITACLRQTGTTDDVKHSFTTRSMRGSRQFSTDGSFTHQVGAGSSIHDLLADAFISLRRSASVIAEKLSNVGVSAECSSGWGCTCITSKVARMLATFEWKNWTNLSASSCPLSCYGRACSVLCKRSFRHLLTSLGDAEARVALK